MVTFLSSVPARKKNDDVLSLGVMHVILVVFVRNAYWVTYTDRFPRLNRIIHKGIVHWPVHKLVRFVTLTRGQRERL